MKKLFSMIIVLGMLFTVVGCGGSKEKGTTADNVVDFTSCKVSLVKDSFNYDGKEKKPEVTVEDQNGSLLDPSHYSVSYKNNVKVGEAQVIVTGKGNYKGTITKTFEIIKEKKTVSYEFDKKALSTALNDVLDYEEGDSGSSLKRAIAGATLLKYANKCEASTNKSELQTAFKEWYATLSKSNKQTFKSNFDSVEDLVDDIFKDINKVKGQLEDAGVYDDVKTALKNKNAKKHWQALEDVIDKFE